MGELLLLPWVALEVNTKSATVLLCSDCQFHIYWQSTSLGLTGNFAVLKNKSNLLIYNLTWVYVNATLVYILIILNMVSLRPWELDVEPLMHHLVGETF